MIRLVLAIQFEQFLIFLEQILLARLGCQFTGFLRRRNRIIKPSCLRVSRRQSADQEGSPITRLLAGGFSQFYCEYAISIGCFRTSSLSDLAQGIGQGGSGSRPDGWENAFRPTGDGFEWAVLRHSTRVASVRTLFSAPPPSFSVRFRQFQPRAQPMQSFQVVGQANQRPLQ